MDPLTAFLLALKAGFELMTEIVKGQPPDLKKQMWEAWWADMQFLRNLSKPKEHQ